MDRIKELEKEIEIYFNKNPREGHPALLDDFLKFAQEFYKDRDNVNWTYSNDIQEQIEEVEEYVDNSSEILLLFKLFERKRLNKEVKAVIDSSEIYTGRKCTRCGAEYEIDENRKCFTCGNTAFEKTISKDRLKQKLGLGEDG